MSTLKNPKDILDYLSGKPYVVEEMKTIWFTSDLHAHHNKIIEICKRPTTPEEHNDWLVKEVINKYVQRKHSLYILGDVSMAKKSEAEKFIDRLNGNKHLILGNHDKQIHNSTKFSEITQIKDFTYSKERLNIHIVLCHFPLASWNRKIYGSFNLFGHCHCKFENKGLSYDVGVDRIGFWKPSNLYEICEIMYERYKTIEDWNKTNVLDMKNIAYVICCNDYPMFVVINDDNCAHIKLELLKRAHFEKLKHDFTSFEQYNKQCSWRIDEVDYI